MNSLSLTLVLVAAACISLALIGSMLLVLELYRKLNRLIGDAHALQRMVTVHGESQLRADAQFAQIKKQLERLQQRDLQLQSLATGLTSFENASEIIESRGVSSAERLAIQTGLTEREANLMIRLKSDYSAGGSAFNGSSGSPGSSRSADGAK